MDLRKIVAGTLLLLLVGSAVGIYFIVSVNKTTNQPYKNIRPGIPNDANIGTMINKIRSQKGAGKLCHDLGLTTCMYVKAYTNYDLKDCASYYKFRNVLYATMNTTDKAEVEDNLKNNAYNFLFDPKYVSFGRHSKGDKYLIFAVSTNECRNYGPGDEKVSS